MEASNATAVGPTAVVPLTWVWAAAAVLLLLALLAVGQIASIVLFIEHDRAARRAAPPIVLSVRALELENRELRSEVAHLKTEMEKRLYAAARAAAREPSAGIAPKVPESVASVPEPPAAPAAASLVQGVAPPPAVRTHRGMVGKSFIVHAGR